MDERIMVKLTASGEFIIFRTVTKSGNRSRCFYVYRDKLLSLRTRSSFLARDNSFAAFSGNEANDELKISFYWLRYEAGNTFTGEIQSVTLPFFDTLVFAEQSAFKTGPKEWKALSKPETANPHLTFSSSDSLREVAGNKLVRRKLSKFLRSNFNWKTTTKNQFFGDCEPYSFFFREYRGDNPGICGGLILHGRENLDKAYYAVHT